MRLTKQSYRLNAIAYARAARHVRSFSVLVFTVNISLMTTFYVVSAQWRLTNIACQDAVPKKRGPKTDVLEALLKRVDGLERRLQEESSTVSSTNENPPSTSKRKGNESSVGRSNSTDKTGSSIQSSLPSVEQKDQAQPSYSRRSFLTQTYNTGVGDHSLNNFRHDQHARDDALLSQTILDTYFTRLHGKPFYILEESSTRQRHGMGQLPGPLIMGIYALTIRYIS